MGGAFFFFLVVWEWDRGILIRHLGLDKIFLSLGICFAELKRRKWRIPRVYIPLWLLAFQCKKNHISPLLENLLQPIIVLPLVIMKTPLWLLTQRPCITSVIHPPPRFRQGPPMGCAHGTSQHASFGEVVIKRLFSSPSITARPIMRKHLKDWREEEVQGPLV